MDLVPSERAVLHIIRALMLESRARAYRVTALRSRWPVTHIQAYEGGYCGLVDKRLIQVSGDKQTFSLTNAGLACLGHSLAMAS